ncbi:endo-beta-N-acetylglucosaminidase, partial [Nocardiopsis gilva]|uniref:endo-beta-N-acetylglucosaminidase n=1 Tax=Nocardiopsis gilva TaxID=280236 RepID=UPI0003628372
MDIPHDPVRPTRRGVITAGTLTALATTIGPRPAAGALPADAPSRTGPGRAARPEAAYWFPDSVPDGQPEEGVVWRSLLDYRPQDDPDLPYNTATVPLAVRVAPVGPHPGAPAGGARVQSLVSFAPTSGNPSQGEWGARSASFYYALTYWSYLEELVFWGGSSAEGLILAPNAPVVDAAHRNGVRVLGTVFLPPIAYGGDLRWTRDLVRLDDATGRYPVADKLAEVAQAYGFDGWFINAETAGGGTALADAMRGFLRHLRTTSALRVCWYDSMTTSGAIAWQNRLNDANEPFFHDAGTPVAHTMFLNFDWTADGLADSAARATRLDRDPHELWAGVDVEARGYGTPVDWDALFAADPAGVTSIGFYRPEWTHTSTPESAPPGEFHRRDDRFWTGPSGDPAAPAPSARWPGVSAHVADRCAVVAAPFGTVFNTGHGLRYAIEGRIVSDREWHHLGVQDVLPPRRWVRRGGDGGVTVDFDFDAPFHGGNSLLCGGITATPVEIDLYPVRSAIAAGTDTVVELVHSGDPGTTVELAVAWTAPARPGEAPPYEYLSAPVEPIPGTSWSRSTFPLPGGHGRTLRALGVRLRSNSEGGAGAEGVRWRLGRLRLAPRTG